MCSITKELKEVWFTICEENEIFQDFLNTSESFNDNTNIVSASQEPFVFNQDPGKNPAQSPPHIDHHCCYGCGDSLDGIFCRRCTYENSFAYDLTPNFVNDSPNVFNPPPQPPPDSYEFCRNDAHYSHDCPPQVPKFNRFSFLKTAKVLLLAWDRVFEIKDAFGNKQYKPEDVQELIRKLFNNVQNIHEELVEYNNTPSWNRPAFSNYDDDDDEDYTIAITPEEPDNSLSMGDEHLDIISATESNEVIKSSVEDLVPIPSESEGILNNMRDVPFCDNSSPLDISKDQFEDFSDSNNDSTSIDDDYFSIDDIDYVAASPLDFEPVILEEVKEDILREKLSKIKLLIAMIESLHDNPTPDRVLKSPSPFPILYHYSCPTLMLDLDFIPSDNSLPESEIFCFDIEEKNSSCTTIHADISLLDFDHFHFKIEPDPGELTSIVDSEIRENILSTTNVNLPFEDDRSPLFAYVDCPDLEESCS
nr:hypothetical protein [Tanacetum cinerariifolium]